MTGLASRRSAISSARPRAASSSGASTDEADGLPHAHAVDPVEAEGGQRPLDGGALGIGDPGAQPHLHEHLELHARRHLVAPYQSAKRRAR